MKHGSGPVNVVKTTPLDLSTTFSALCGREIYLKLENLQKTGSFKVRGALNKIQLLDPAARARGVITASAGNHAQGVAYAARMAGVAATVVMPETAAFSKVEATSGYGAQVVLAGRDYNEAYERATTLAVEQGATFVHAFDDADVIAGQATLGLELLEQLPDVDTIVVPVGGGGLLAGLISAFRGAGSRARIIGVQAAGASSLKPSLRNGVRVQLDHVDTIADGLATRSIGARPFEIIKAGVDDAVEVSDAEIAEAVLLLLERAKTVVEGAGAVGLAACLAGRVAGPGFQSRRRHLGRQHRHQSARSDHQPRLGARGPAVPLHHAAAGPPRRAATVGDLHRDLRREHPPDPSRTRAARTWR